MTTYILRRLIQAVIVILLVTVLIFFLMRLLPGDPIRLYLGDTATSYSEEEIAQLREEFHLDEPLIQQYFRWLGGAVKGDLGYSISSGDEVGTRIAKTFPVTLNLAVLAILISSIVGPFFGIIAAIRRGKWQDTTVSVLANLGITLPNFWVGIVLMYIFANKLGWLDVFPGYVSPFEDFGSHVKHLIMPVLSLALFGLAAQTRQARSSMLEVSHQDYIRTAWSKGLTERIIVKRHLLKNGLIPVVTTLGIQVGFMLGGSVLVENVFAIDGIGGMLSEAINGRDYQAVQGVVLLMACIIVAVNIIVDVAYAWLDPRIRQSYR